MAGQVDTPQPDTTEEPDKSKKDKKERKDTSSLNVSMDRFLSEGVPGHAALKPYFHVWLTKKDEPLTMRPMDKWLELYNKYLKE